ncbi:S-norcoclaurine synthase [Tripterygium wilfordii]|uniref:S-norcoclaurine synthase n=1 Tax=Tripterygium wilfordii TaxID=458696 RepID=A0A7J7CMK0_TRIWF|nr:norbelladine synthase-like [Tripterygium wilfordii]KAF5735317.1 S-norcoclaurine synthase [Tripterygium wilfordii]
MDGQLSHELELNVPASEAWEFYSTLKLAKLVEEQFDFIEKAEVLEGDGGVGTIIGLTFAPGIPGPVGYKEKFTKLDNENRVKEAEVVEGGYLDLGFTLYRVRFEVIEKGEDSSIIRNTIEYTVKEEAAANASFVSIEPLADIAELVKNHLAKNKTS